MGISKLTRKKTMKVLIVSVLLLISWVPEGLTFSCLCDHESPETLRTPTCCDSGFASYDECACFLRCLKPELGKCGGSQIGQSFAFYGIRCMKGTQCVKHCVREENQPEWSDNCGPKFGLCMKKRIAQHMLNNTRGNVSPVRRKESILRLHAYNELLRTNLYILINSIRK